VKTDPPPRLALLRASRAAIALILRRGPSKWVEAIRWHFTTDTFECGHWFHGRIYDKRSDLSPDGELLVYFASQFNRRSAPDGERLYAWTAVSRAPWLTALALWPKEDCWWGGGLFTGRRSLWLNHKPEESTPHPQHRPKGLRIESNPKAHGENEPIYRRRLDRDGWTLRQQWSTEWQGLPLGYRTIVPDERMRSSPLSPAIGIVLTRRIDNLSYREHFHIEGAANEVELPPGPLNWLDWDARGRVVALSGGKIWAAQVDDTRVGRFAELLDLRSDRPENRAPPVSATRW
jgi:hypothetical protein